MIKSLQEFYDNIAKRVLYWLPILFFSIAAYAFSLSNRTLGVDDLMNRYYWDPAYEGIPQGRWGFVVLGKIFGIMDFTPFTAKFLGLVCYILAGVVLGCILYLLNGRKKEVLPYSILTSVLITYPLINEIWEYHLANAFTTLGLLVSTLVVLYLLTRSKKTWRAYLTAALPLTLTCASYEVGAFAYVAVVCMLLFYKYVMVGTPNRPKWLWFQEGMTYAVPLILAVVFRFAVQFAFQIESSAYGDTGIAWGTQSPLVLLLRMAYTYVLNGLLYFPIGVFVLAAICFAAISIVQSVKKHSPLPVLLGICVFCGVFVQFFLQGKCTPYRNALPLTVFVAFTAFLLTELSWKSRRQYSRICIAGLMLLLCWHQSAYLNRLVALNNQRSDNEMALVRQIGYELKSHYEDKPVAFVGQKADFLGEWISSRVYIDPDSINGKAYLKLYSLGKQLFQPEEDAADYMSELMDFKYVDTNVNSSISWSMDADHMMQDYFSYCGYDIRVVEPRSQAETLAELTETAKKAHMNRFDILDTGEYLIVCLGSLE